MAGQNIENVTKHHLLGLIVNNKFLWQAQNTCAKACQKHTHTCFFFLRCNISSTSTPEKILQRSRKTSHRLCVSGVGWLWRSTPKIELPTSKANESFLILPLELSTERKMSALRILNLPQQLPYNKGVFMHKVLGTNSPNYREQLFTSYQSHYTNSRNNLYVPRTRLDLFKISISFTGASLWNSRSENINFCISLPYFKPNLQRYMSENNLSSNLDDLF